jgi:hypothetical protein
MEIAQRPPTLSGCWKSWQERDVDVVLRTEMDSGAVHTRRRFTGRSRVVAASVTLKAELYDDFVTWFFTNCRQGSIPTYVVNPLGQTEIFQFMKPPAFSWDGADNKSFTVSCELYNASWFQP